MQDWQFRHLTETYLNACTRKWAFLKFNEKPLPLEQVFVQPVVLPLLTKELDDVFDDALSIPCYPHNGEEILEEPEIPNQPAQYPITLFRALHQSPHMAILGEAGSGKSTALQFIAYSFSRYSPEDICLNPALLQDNIPLLIDLNHHAELIVQKKAGISEAACREVAQILHIDDLTAVNLVERWRNSGRLLLLLDSLNEVQNSCMNCVRRKIGSYAAAADGKKTRMVIASRPAGICVLEGEITPYRLIPFTGNAKVRSYLSAWLSILCPACSKSENDKQAIKIMDEMGRLPGLYNIRQNPFLLRLAAEIHANPPFRPVKNRAGLLSVWSEHAIEQALNQPPPKKNVQEVLEALEQLAWHLQNERGALPHEMPQELVKRNLLVCYEKQRWKFNHSLMQDYFNARRLAKAWQHKQRSTWYFIKSRLHLPEWREPFLLLAALLEPARGQEIISKVLHAASAKEALMFRDLGLAVSMLAEGAAVSPGTAKTIRKKISEKILSIGKAEQLDLFLQQISQPLPVITDSMLEVLSSYQNSKPARKKTNEYYLHVIPQLCDTLGRLKDRHTVQPLIDLLKDENWQIRRSAADALAQLKAPSALTPLMAALQDYNMCVRYSAAAALGTLQDAAALTSLVSVIKSMHENEDTRLWAAIALGQIQDVVSIQPLLDLLNDHNWIIRLSAARALGNIQEPSSFKTLVMLLLDEDKDVRHSAAHALARVQDADDVKQLCAIVKGSPLDIRRSAAVFIGKTNSPFAVCLEIELLKDENWYVRCAAAEALGEMRSEEAVQPLVELLQDADARRTAAEALGKMRHKAAVKPLSALLQDENFQIRHTASMALNELTDPFSIRHLAAFLKVDGELAQQSGENHTQPSQTALDTRLIIRLLQDENWFIRATAAAALAQEEISMNVPALIDLLRDENWFVRRSAVKAAGMYKNTAVLQMLIDLLKDDCPYVRRAAGEILALIQNPDITEQIQHGLEDKDTDMKRLLTGILGKRQNPSAIQPLYALWKDKNEQLCIRHLAAINLASMHQPVVIKYLIDLLQDESKRVRQLAASALCKMPFYEIIDILQEHPALYRRLQTADITLLCLDDTFYQLQAEMERRKDNKEMPCQYQPYPSPEKPEQERPH